MLPHILINAKQIPVNVFLDGLFHLLLPIIFTFLVQSCIQTERNASFHHKLPDIFLKSTLIETHNPCLYTIAILHLRRNQQIKVVVHLYNKTINFLNKTWLYAIMMAPLHPIKTTGIDILPNKGGPPLHWPFVTLLKAKLFNQIRPQED